MYVIIVALMTVKTTEEPETQWKQIDNNLLLWFQQVIH